MPFPLLMIIVTLTCWVPQTVLGDFISLTLQTPWGDYYPNYIDNKAGKVEIAQAEHLVSGRERIS